MFAETKVKRKCENSRFQTRAQINLKVKGLIKVFYFSTSSTSRNANDANLGFLSGSDIIDYRYH